MKKFFGKKRLVALSVVAVLAVAGAAVAYWTTSGSGTGSGSVGTSDAVSVSQVGSVTNLVPGGDAQNVDFKINNPKSTPQYVTSVSVSISSVTAPNADATHPCAAGDFTLSQPTVTPGDLSTGDHTFSANGSTLKMNDSASNQDGCKGATVNLAFSAQ